MKKYHSISSRSSAFGMQLVPTIGRRTLLILAALVFLICPLCVQAQFVKDTFTGTAGTALSAHTTDSGATWHGLSSVFGPADMALDGSGRVYVSNIVGGYAYANASPSSAEYQVQVTLYLPVLFGIAGVIARCDSSVWTCYAAYARSGSGGTHIYLSKFVNGTETILGTYTHTPSSGDVIMLQCYNSAKTVYLNGTSVLTSTDNTITAAGYPGIYLWNDADDDEPGDDFEVEATFSATNKP